MTRKPSVRQRAIVKAPSTVGVSPKVVAALLTSLATFLVTKLGLQWNPVLEQLINAVAPLIAAVLAPPGKVEGSVVHEQPPTW